MKLFQQILLVLFLLTLFLYGVFWLLASIPRQSDAITYGVTFSKFRTDELGLDWKETYDALVDDLGVRHFRFVAHWDITEPEEGVFDFTALDYQMKRAEETGSMATIAIGRRLPSWPECHMPEWAERLPSDERDQKLLEYMQTVIERYKDSPALKWWQIENEPYIIGFAYENCGSIDSHFLEKEIDFVRSADPDHPVLLTASGELGFWNNTWSRADAFGTTLYRYVYNADLKSFITYPTTPSFFRAKRTFTELTVRNPDIPAVISELAAEPWPVKAIVDTSLEEQFTRMNLTRFDKIIEFASKTSFVEQYLWGAEWWYYLKVVHGDDSFWERARKLF